MRAIATAMSFATLMLALGASAQNTAQVQVVNASHPLHEATSPDFSAAYCSGFVTDEKVATEVPWFKWQEKLLKAMGTQYIDAGQLEITTVQPNVSIGLVKFSCDYLQRGDIALPMAERPSPPFKPAEKFDKFAPVSGKSVGMLVAGLTFTEAYGKNSTVYVNLGTNQGVKVGDYLRKIGRASCR